MVSVLFILFIFGLFIPKFWAKIIIHFGKKLVKMAG